MSPAKLLLAIHEQGQTGILYFRQNEILKVFYLNRGKISWSISSDEEDKLDHVLLSLKLVDPNNLVPYQAGNKIAESFGKVLVENGVITLETLIQATREQVRRIINGVLHWRSGNFQLVQEPPPTRMVSLDMDTPSLVFQYIVEQMDMNIVWDELGALSGELQQVSDPGKKGLYPLDTEQQGIFSRFREPQRLEAVLQEFPTEGKFRILKIIHYLILTGLLVRKEPEKASGLDFKELDSLFGQPAENAPSEVDIEMPAMIDEAAVQDIPLNDLPDMNTEREERRQPSPPPSFDFLPPESPEEMEDKPAPREKAKAMAAREQSRPTPFRLPEKQKPRWRSVGVLSVLLTLALVGAVIWLTRSTDKTAPEDTKPAAAENKPETPDQTGPAADPAGSQTEGSAAATGTDAASGEPAAAGSRQPARNETADATPPDTGQERPAAASENRSPLELFHAGDFRAAGEAWRAEILSKQIKFSILLEMDCVKESVQNAYRQLTNSGDFFLLNKTSRDNRACWLVLWGRYRTVNEAELGLSLVPEYFQKQSSPPSVVELEPYL